MDKILIIDDEQSYQIKIKFILEKSIKDCVVISALSGPEGIKLAKEEQPDTILLDVVMPEIDGFEVCKLLKSDEETKVIPLILASAFQKDTGSRVLGLESGADVFLSKPFDPTELAAQVASMLRIRKAEKAIQENNAKFRTVADYAYDWEYWTDKDGKLIYNSPSCERITGYSTDEFIKDPSLLYNIVHENDRETVKAHNLQIVSNNNCDSLEFRIIAKDGSERWIGHVCQTVFDKDGNNIGIRASNREITKRKIAEEKVKIQTRELSERNEELDAFAHTVAHDLRTPIGTIIGFADLLKGNYGISEDEKKEFLSHIEDTGHKTLQILNNLLLFANIRKADAPIHNLNMLEIVNESRKRLLSVISENNVSLIYPEVWPLTKGYAPWVEEIWVNFISNAIKYGGVSPNITIGSNIEIDNNNIEMIRYWVRDNGEGISTDDQKLLFEQFVRLKQAKIKGHGLGLSIVRRVVEKLGGKVGVESKIGEGSMFYFTLPKA